MGVVKNSLCVLAVYATLTASCARSYDNNAAIPNNDNAAQPASIANVVDSEPEPVAPAIPEQKDRLERIIRRREIALTYSVDFAGRGIVAYRKRDYLALRSAYEKIGKPQKAQELDEKWKNIEDKAAYRDARYGFSTKSFTHPEPL